MTLTEKEQDEDRTPREEANSSKELCWEGKGTEKRGTEGRNYGTAEFHFVKTGSATAHRLAWVTSSY